MIRVKIEMSDDLKRFVRDDFAERVSALIYSCAEVVKSKIAVYPGPVKHPVQWTSLKQKIWVLNNVQPLPYVRMTHPKSQRLGNSYKIRKVSKGYEVISEVTYAAYVQAEQYQQPMHKNTGWVTDRQAVERAEPEIHELFRTFALY